MDLKAIDPLNAFQVANRLNVTVRSTKQISGVASADIEHLLGEGREEWSAFTLRIADRNLIVINEAQSARRQNSVLMHELAHIILGHELVSVQFTKESELVPKTYGQDQEDEAAWLGGTLLLPRPALLWMRRKSLSNDTAATYFKVSPELLIWRVRMTGIDYQLGLK
jgi:Zn-dependent peptidase ImmA (M78 family)